MDNGLIRRRDVEAAIIADSYGRYCPPEPVDPYSWALSFVKDVPAVDAVEVRHGWWIFDECPDGYYSSYCSLCGFRATGDAYLSDWNYCPSCGAKMDGQHREGGDGDG